ncbi:23S rRNA (adenine(2030)-N(6))-methyltransferase RlmJ [Litorilituus sediminis]|uniref:Ribosomal RNA large subunit methyltransferase J n=1 Tax=Litorilituus sediminis TaxID=718192 RepID=A0A4P6PA61_9GAMM|nr:23S rRNA (adenine(2030)-N(6))-methyltransferase RlmJ [Litorilituus sediminis]QBG36502.1 23S rRNA (adenine(2030)-N(6))-methyltransferase RlmJ [Litorilituus sediminis]
MLSYRHSFHAGNFADVIKHIVLVEILEHLIKKDSPFDYIDTHSGAGIYDLWNPDSQKLQEYTEGVGKLDFNELPELEKYYQVIRSLNKFDAIDIYPGSPSIANFYLRRQDRGWLFELHPKDYDLLSNNFSDKKNMRVHHKDGYDGLNALVPPISRRGLVLIDPSYEIKSEYHLVIDRVIKAHKKFSNGIYAIWYPVVDRHSITRMEEELIKSGIRDIQRFELGISDDSSQRGMTSSGMIVINPPWRLFEKMSQLLPKIASIITQVNRPIYKCEIIVDE